MVFSSQILVLIFMDVCGKFLREKNGDAHKGIQNVTVSIVIRIVTCLKYHDTYRDKNSVSLHSYYIYRITTVFECQDLNLMKFWPMHFFPRFDAIKIILALKIFCPRLNADKMSSLNNNVSS